MHPSKPYTLSHIALKMHLRQSFCYSHTQTTQTHNKPKTKFITVAKSYYTHCISRTLFENSFKSFIIANTYTYTRQCNTYTYTQNYDIWTDMCCSLYRTASSCYAARVYVSWLLSESFNSFNDYHPDRNNALYESYIIWSGIW